MFFGSGSAFSPKKDSASIADPYLVITDPVLNTESVYIETDKILRILNTV
jgi:hypothetical protein